MSLLTLLQLNLGSGAGTIANGAAALTGGGDLIGGITAAGNATDSATGQGLLAGAITATGAGVDSLTGSGTLAGAGAGVGALTAALSGAAEIGATLSAEGAAAIAPAETTGGGSRYRGPRYGLGFPAQPVERPIVDPSPIIAALSAVLVGRSRVHGRPLGRAGATARIKGSSTVKATLRKDFTAADNHFWDLAA